MKMKTWKIILLFLTLSFLVATSVTTIAIAYSNPNIIKIILAFVIGGLIAAPLGAYLKRRKKVNTSFKYLKVKKEG
jgi:uncharacterized integral membrane protein